MEGVKILMIIADKDFRDEEYLVPREVFEDEGIEVRVANASSKESEGSAGTKVMPDYNIGQAVVDDFDAIVFVGGVGAKIYKENEAVLQMVRDAYNLNKIIGAICIAPLILSRAGIIKGKNITVAESGIEKIKEEGAVYTGSEVEADGNIVTASGPSASEKFAKKIIELLENK